ncbi:uncharacterized mitochondrial protein AtMg00860-like [Nicotiana sylvestris]|uniref:uncharacterized mitochondrial protein AtMg00860-like n=1 Tax=Nicotiana sylvestris TaxID=4096 RepID=UPI00388C41CB
MNQEQEYNEDEAFREINRELEQFENKPKPNLNEIEPVNLGSSEEVQETMISIHADERTRDALEVEVYVDKVIIKSRTQDDNVRDLRKFFECLCKYDLKLNPTKCAFGVLSGKPLGFIVSRRGIDIDPTNIKSIRDFPPTRTKKEVLSLLGRLNYISRFIAQLTSMCEPIFKLLKKDAAIRWTDECQEDFDKIKEYLTKPPVLVQPEPRRPLFLYLTL